LTATGAPKVAGVSAAPARATFAFSPEGGTIARAVGPYYRYPKLEVAKKPR